MNFLDLLQPKPTPPSPLAPADQDLKTACEIGDVNMAIKSIAAGANVNLRLPTKKKNTMLLVASSKGNSSVVEVLLDHGAKWELRQEETEATALHIASKKGHLDVMVVLMKRGIPAAITSAANWQPLHYAAIHGRVEAMDLLVKFGADVNAQTEQGNTAICMAARNWKNQVVRFLISRNADPNIVDTDGASPVIHACRVGALSAIKILVEEGKADVTCQDKLGNTALDEAEKLGMWECALYVWQRGCDSGTLKKTRGLDPVRWIRPRMIEAPSARYQPGCAVVGSVIYVLGGNGLKEGTVNSDPDNRLEIPSKLLNDFHMLDINTVEKQYIVDLIDKSSRKNIVLSKERVGEFIRVHDDLLTCETLIEHDEEEDSEASSIQSSQPFLAEEGFGYFEILIVNPGTKGIVTMGIADENYPLNKIPGWVKDSAAFHGDDGSCFRNSGTGKPWGRRYTTGDVVGCGINFKTKEVFFTLNGEFLGVAYKGVGGTKYFATIGFKNPLAKITANFSGPFMFNFEVPTLKWTQLNPVGEAPPGGRLMSLFPLDPYHLLHINDFRPTFDGIVWVYNIDAQAWKTVVAKGVRPLLLEHSHLVFLNKRLYVYVTAQNADQGIPEEILPKYPALFVLDTTLPTWEWFELFPRCKNVPAELLEAIKENIAGVDILLSDIYKNSPMVAVENELAFLGEDRILFVNPETMVNREKRYLGARPSAKHFSSAVVGRDIQTFGGWDERRQQNDVNILDTVEATWYKPHVYGPMPRPRNHHFATVVRSTEDTLSLFEDQEPTEDKQLVANQGAANAAVGQELTKTFIAHISGWNGRNFIDDFELLALDMVQAADELAQFFDSEALADAELHCNNSVIRANRVVLACRSSYFRDQFASSATEAKAQLQIEAPVNLLRPLISYLYTDVLDIDAVHSQRREFVKLVEKFAPEQLNRIRESLVLTRMTVASTMGKELKWGFRNTDYSDVILEVSGERFVAHKVVLCARSAYFNALMTGGLKESAQREVSFPETNPDAFAIVLQYMYTKELDVDEVAEQIVDVFALACQYGLKALKSELETLIAYNLSEDNVSSLIVMADAQGAFKLRSACAKYITAHSAAVKASPEFMQHSDSIDRILSAYRATEAAKEAGRREAIAVAEHRRQAALAAWKKETAKQEEDEADSDSDHDDTMQQE